MGSIPYSAPPPAPAPHQGPTTADTNSTPQACSKHENGILCIILLRPYLIATVAVICGAFLFLSYYQVLIRSLCSNNDSSFSRNSSQRRRLDEASSDNPSLQIRSRGLDYSVIQCLPISQFKPKDAEEGRRDNTNCAICLGEFEERETIKRLPNCGHEFHAACIDTWFRSNSNCPLCRSRVDDLSVTVNILRETLRREEFFREREAHYLTVRAEVLRNAGHGLRGQLRTFHIIWVQKSSSDFGKKANLTAKVFPHRGPWNYKEIHSLL